MLHSCHLSIVLAQLIYLYLIVFTFLAAGLNKCVLVFWHQYSRKFEK